MALRVKSEKKAKIIHGLQYLAKPMDSIIQAIAMPIFTVIDHLRDLKREVMAKKSLKVLLTPITLPLKLFCALFVSVGYLSVGGFQVVVPYSMIFGIKKGKEAAHRFFYEVSEIRNTHSHKLFHKPLQILPIRNEELNPFCQRREKLLLEMDPEFRDFNNIDNLSGGESPKQKKFRECVNVIKTFKNHCKKNPGDQNSDYYKELQVKVEAAKEELKGLPQYCINVNKAIGNYDKIMKISEEITAQWVINTGNLMQHREYYNNLYATTTSNYAQAYFTFFCRECGQSRVTTDVNLWANSL